MCRLLDKKMPLSGFCLDGPQPGTDKKWLGTRVQEEGSRGMLSHSLHLGIKNGMHRCPRVLHPEVMGTALKISENGDY